MATYPYVANPARAKALIQQLQDVGVPAKVTTNYLESLGYKSKNDRTFLGLLRAIGFIDASGVPTDVWRQYRNKSNAKVVIATALRTTYKDLFATYADAYRRDNEALRNFFSSHTSVGESALRFMVATFKTLSELGDFGAVITVDDDESDEADEENVDGAVTISKAKGQKTTRNGIGTSGVTVNINIQLQIPETEKSEVYDSFFAAMKKHLLS
jgi:hypothetical protein